MEKMTSLSDAEKFQSVHFHRFEISVLLLSHPGTSAYGQQELISNASPTKDHVTLKFKTFPSDFKKLLCREKPQMNQLGLRSLLDDDASSQKVTDNKQGKLHNR